MIRSKNAITITAQTRPTRSLLKRRHEACHTPSDRSTAITAAGALMTALI
jgi:hypothetical protein